MADENHSGSPARRRRKTVSNAPAPLAHPMAPDGIFSVPPCSFDIEGYVPFSWAVYWMVPKKINNSKADINVRDWKVSRSKLVSWIGSKKVTLMGRRFGRSENKPLPPELLVNHPAVDWVCCPPDHLDWPPPPNTPFLQCYYCPAIKYWQHTWTSSDLFFNASHIPEWTHLQVNMTEVVVASKTSVPQPEPSAAVPPEFVTIDLPTRNGNGTPQKWEIVGWTPTTSNAAPELFDAQAERRGTAAPAAAKKADDASAAGPAPIVLPALQAAAEETPASPHKTDHPSGIKAQAALLAIRKAFPDGIPAKTEVPDKPFCKTVREKLSPAMALPPQKGGMSDTTILRAAGRKK
jgi:hypothetical protein